MTVFVDDMYLYPMGQFRRMKMSHMIATTDEELHAFAERIGVARRWFQRDHYDIAISKRSRALDLGAHAVTLRQLGIMCMIRRRYGYLPEDPIATEQLWKIHIWASCPA